MSEEIVVKDRRRKEFFMVQNYVIDLPIFEDSYEGFVYLVLCRHADQKGTAFPTVDTLAKKCYCSKNRVIKSINRLIEKKIITKVQKYKNSGGFRFNIYYINDIPKEILNAAKEKKEEMLKKEQADLSSSSEAIPVHYEDPMSSPDEPSLVHHEDPMGSPDEPSLVHHKDPMGSPGEPKEYTYKNTNIKNTNIKISLLERDMLKYIQGAKIHQSVKETLIEWLDYRKSMDRPLKSIRILKKILSCPWIHEEKAADFIEWCMDHDWVFLDQSYFEDYMQQLSFEEDELPVLS